MIERPDNLVLRTSAMMYTLLGGTSAGVCALTAFVAAKKDPTFWLPTAVTGAILAIFMSWMGTTKLALMDNAVCYRSLFMTKRVPLEDIMDANLLAGFSGYEPFQRLVLDVRGAHDRAAQVIINTGLFDRQELRLWLEALKAQLS